MAVETYVETELQDLITDVEKNEEWKKKVEELGLAGQVEMIAGKKSPIPFPIMNSAMKNVYKTLCPRSQDVTKYARTTIPSRVLEMIGLCVKENYFPILKVWFDDVQPDPILVGYTKDNEWDGERHIIARWGDELRSYPELREIARKRLVESQTPKIAVYVSSLDARVQSFLDGNSEFFLS